MHCFVGKSSHGYTGGIMLSLSTLRSLACRGSLWTWVRVMSIWGWEKMRADKVGGESWQPWWVGLSVEARKSISGSLSNYKADRRKSLEFNREIPWFLFEGLSFSYTHICILKFHNWNRSTLFICSLSAKGKLQDGSWQRGDYGLHLINGYLYVLACSGAFSGYNFIAELTSSHKIWQQALYRPSEMKLQLP